ncbi:GntR family transcriptional regulator [Sandaracinobacteroides saxicola]|uniref:GntR family transcriptional regulator n=1 Tax=Sandaracinobacteroides saxicola TaxID=2759707 RepID=A0A7G5II80_9SPHN|nr:GntR family transcriptional regulator [Sandaracinobacteroides saxicola]QMW23072.1 GntR family transcriptional regulator [Sandaracinobacteroides saxicola]
MTSEAKIDDEEISSVAAVVDAIVDGVMRGRYVQGQRLIAADLAEEYNVSRAPVREALHMLAGEGVVELVANRGARIRRLSPKELVEFLEFTEAICVLGVRLATARMSEEAPRAVIIEAFARIEDAWIRRHPQVFVEALYRYHIELNALSGNAFLDFFYRRPYIRFYTTLLAELAPGGHWEQYILNYRQIHAMILSGDAHSSVVTFVSHIRWVLTNMRNSSKG